MTTFNGLQLKWTSLFLSNRVFSADILLNLQKRCYFPTALIWIKNPQIKGRQKRSVHFPIFPPHPSHHSIESQNYPGASRAQFTYSAWYRSSWINIGEISTCMPKSFETILAAQPFLFEEGMHPCPLTIWNLNSWAKATGLSLYLPSHTFSAPNGQLIQGGDRSKTMLLILS